MSKQLFGDVSKSRTDAPKIDPEDFVIIGLDTDDGPEHPAWDERANLPVNDALVQGMIAVGFFGAVICDKHDDGRPRVRKGRQRVKAARAANKILRVKGMEPILVTALGYTKGTDERTKLLMSIAENELRVDDAPMVKAAKAARALASLGADDRETRRLVATAFGFGSLSMLDELLRLRESGTPELLRAVREEKIAPAAAAAVAALPAGKQAAVVDRVDRGEKVTTDDAREMRARETAKKNGVADEDRKHAMSRATVTKLADHYGARTDLSDAEQIVRSVLALVLGRREARGIPGMVDALKAIDRIYNDLRSQRGRGGRV